MAADTGINTRDILLFLSVVETGSFTAASTAFGLSRSATGKAVARLEDRFGARLLNRTTRALSLTQEGQRLFEHAQAIRAAIQNTEADMGAQDGTPRGTLRIAAPDAVGRRILMPVIRRYLDDWPKVQLEVSYSDRVENLVEDGFDLAIRVGVTTPPQGLIARTIYTDTPVLCAAPSYLRDKAAPQNAEQLSLHDVLLFSSQGQRQNWKLQEKDGNWARALGRSRLRLESGEALREAALAGMGIALLPRLVIAADLAAKRLEPILPSLSCGSLPVVALYPHKRHLEPRLRHFIDALVSHLKSAGAVL